MKHIRGGGVLICSSKVLSKVPSKGSSVYRELVPPLNSELSTEDDTTVELDVAVEEAVVADTEDDKAVHATEGVRVPEVC